MEVLRRRTPTADRVLPWSSCADLQRVPTAGIWDLACDVLPWSEGI